MEKLPKRDNCLKISEKFPPSARLWISQPEAKEVYEKQRRVRDYKIKPNTDSKRNAGLVVATPTLQSDRVGRRRAHREHLRSTLSGTITRLLTHAHGGGAGRLFH